MAGTDGYARGLDTIERNARCSRRDIATDGHYIGRWGCSGTSRREGTLSAAGGRGRLALAAELRSLRHPLPPAAQTSTRHSEAGISP
jgi:hypothetical protein